MKTGTQDSSNLQTTTKPAEDETLKRNTDCVYFLASPLTCKKGIECEYRHSEEARMNPRDCWYWMNSNCLNPKCPFRHPPLDGLVGTAVPTSAKSSLPPSVAAASTQLPTTHNSAANFSNQVKPQKQATPCYYFQNGHCLKGDRCPFMHEPHPVDNSAPKPPATRVPIPVIDHHIPKKPVEGLQRCTTQQQRNSIKPVEIPSTSKPPSKPELVLSTNGGAGKKTVPVTSSFYNEAPRYKATNYPSVGSELVSRTHHSRQANPMDFRIPQNGKEPDDLLADSSPGFDVLVDNDVQGSDYFHNEDEIGRTGLKKRDGDNNNDLDFRRSSDHSSIGKFDQESYDNSRGYVSYGRTRDPYVKEQRRPSSDRASERPVISERRGYLGAESPGQTDESDLRNRLKHRKINGSRSAVSPDHRDAFYRTDVRGRYVEDERIRDHSRSDPHRSNQRESSIRSNRLQGRIKIPGRSSPDSKNYSGSHQESESARVRDVARISSPSRIPVYSIQGRLQDTIKRRTNEDVNIEGRNFRAAPSKRDEVDANTLNFAGPKSLAELKGSKVPAQNNRKPVTRELVNYQESGEGSHSFDGPKPLSVILKRKREAGSSGDDAISGNEEEPGFRRKGEEIPGTRSRTREVPEEESEVPFEPTLEEGQISKEDVAEEGLIYAEGDDDIAHETHFPGQKGSEFQEEDAMLMDKVEEQESETDVQEDGEYDYEPVEGDENFKTEEADFNLEEAEEEFSDEDDFAKRIGVMFP